MLLVLWHLQTSHDHCLEELGNLERRLRAEHRRVFLSWEGSSWLSETSVTGTVCITRMLGWAQAGRMNGCAGYGCREGLIPSLRGKAPGGRQREQMSTWSEKVKGGIFRGGKQDPNLKNCGVTGELGQRSQWGWPREGAEEGARSERS